MCSLLVVAASNSLVESTCKRLWVVIFKWFPCIWFLAAWCIFHLQQLMLRASSRIFYIFLLARGSSRSGPQARAPSGVLLRQSCELLGSEENLMILHLSFASSSSQPLYFTVVHTKFNEGICFSLLLNYTNVFHTVCCSVSVQWNWNNKNVITFSRFSICRCFLCPPWGWMTEGGSNSYWVASESANIINLLAEKEKRAKAACVEPVNISLCGGQLQSL